MDKIKGFIGFLSEAQPRGLLGWPKEVLQRFKHDSLFQNSVYLMLSSGVMAFFGFLFWIIAARAYPPEQIGFATALISATILLSNIGLLGFNSSLIRYLPRAEKPNALINTAIIIVSAATLLVAGVYLLGLPTFAPDFSDLTTNPTYGALFMVFMVMVSINTLTDSVFIAYRASKYNLIVYIFFGLIKVGLPLVLAGFGAYGIFFAYTGSVIAALGLSWYFMTRFKYRFGWTIDKAIAKKMTKFSLANYVATFLSGLPILIMPTLLVTYASAEASAYYYMAAAIAGLLYIIPQATTDSLFAEGSHNEQAIAVFVKSSAKLIGALLLPAVLAIFFLGQYLLLIFGDAYSENGLRLLQVMSATAIFLAVNLIAAAILKVQHQLKALIIVNGGYLAVTLLLTYMLLPKGALGAAIALLGGQVFACLEYLTLFGLRRLRSPQTT